MNGFEIGGRIQNGDWWLTSSVMRCQLLCEFMRLTYGLMLATLFNMRWAEFEATAPFKYEITVEQSCIVAR